MKKTIKGILAFAVISLAVSCNMGKDKNEVVTTDTSSTTNVTDNFNDYFNLKKYYLKKS